MENQLDYETKSNGKKGKKSGGFQSLALSESVYRGIVKMGFRVPTPVQRKSLPVILSGVDTVVMARTGSGKTAAFLIPVLERVLASRETQSTQKNPSAAAVILSPTRELSLQTLRVLKTLSSYCPQIKSIGINGGESMEKQFSLLSSKPDIICATPGRLAHHLNEIPDFNLNCCDVVVFDEADRLFEMGFALQIRSICSSMPSSDSGRQTLLFSATMPKVLVEFTKSGIMGDPQVVRLDSEASVSDELRIGFITVRSAEKDAALLYLLREVLPQTPVLATDHASNSSLDEVKQKSVGANGDKHKRKIDVIKITLGLTLIFAATRHHVDYITTLINNSGMVAKATCIYGAMDQEARKMNLSLFRSGKYPILVVTDVAARGIDVPLIDHVVHYSFPPSAKLFVHRSGRAARAGRVGYCWGLVDTEELPYMVDLYLFLGRKLSCGRVNIKQSREEDGPDERESEFLYEDRYSVTDMTPQMVHYGSIPESVVVAEIENVRRIIDSELTASHDAQTLRSLIKVCENAMKQYRRSRPEASVEGKRRAREILEGKKDESGKRTGKGRIPCHPVLRDVEFKAMLALGTNTQQMDELRRRDEFLQSLSNFRPKETVFEAFATGGGKDVGVLSHIDKGRTTQATRKIDTSLALSAMKGMRRQMKIVRDKSALLIVAGSHDTNGLSSGGTVDQNDIPGDPDEETYMQEIEKPSKRRISKFLRRKLKKNPNENHESSETIHASEKTKRKRGADFRDSAHYINRDLSNDTDVAFRSREIEKAMQPSAASAKDSFSSAMRLEEAMLDIVGDENVDLVQRHRINRWDKSKRKYVQTTIGSELSGDSKSKKVRLESGQHFKQDKMKLGEIYEKWQKKTNKSIGRFGIFDDEDKDDTHSSERRNGSGNIAESWIQKKSQLTDDKKNAVQIKKLREAEKKMRLKNMKRKDRRRIEHNVRVERNKKATEAVKTKGFLKKKRR